ncbi:MAG TPA: hypothetical protein VND40_00550 [Nitrososphaerales archaeon]|nr:hypothetical protein [Nitrososphaerales archaeon]
MKILLGTLKDKGDELAAFLEPRIGVKGDVSGGELDIEDKSLKKGIRSRHVKTYIKRFLSIEKVRERYRVLVDGGELRLVELETDEEIEEELKEEEAKKKTESYSEKEAAKAAEIPTTQAEGTTTPK